ncbi:helix-turn-helix transcriptional regulator [uncultured Anaerococcus sp.]|uniref:helix-turn-helix transcriptional regulator n=1 Tax=uncultured Anaerococcus sp. TaxID=293428 RepID=UPI002806041B|nr:helix-turn-helix transcriptional regulator [uncultured Anaerococcus sp.]
MKTIGQKLVTLRGEQDIEIVAKAIGVTKQAIWNYENDKRIPRDDIKRKIADYYNTSVGNIFFN